MAEGPRKPAQDRVRDLLEAWREAEREVEKHEPGSAAYRMARQLADTARTDYHESEDVEREVQGNHRERKHPDEARDTEDTG